MFLRISLTILCNVCSVFANPTLVETGKLEPTHRAILDTNELVTLHWAYNDTYIVMRLEVKSTAGWVGFGVAPTGSMTGSDLAVMWMDGTTPKLLDMHAEANGLPHNDELHNIDLIAGEISDGKTIFTFGRQLIACDGDGDNDISEDTLRILWAYGTSNPTDGVLTIEHKHETNNRGSRSLKMLSQQITFNPNDDGLKTVDIVFDEVEIPAEVTYYHCRIQKIDLGRKKNHVVQFTPIVQPGNELFVHHMLVYICSGLSNFTDGKGHRCYTANMPDEYGKCSELVYAWAIGGGPFTFPEDVGFPLNDSAEEVYLFTEMHYDNPNKVVGKRDSSGFSLTFTDNLRQKEAGILQVGELVSDLHFIPAGAKNWKTFSKCSANCLSGGFTEGQESVKVFAVGLHTHLFGRKLRLRHYRNGREIKPLSRDDTYDFNYQEYSVFTNEIELKKGDSLAMECEYDTTGQTEPVYGGLGTEEEMCLAFLYTYPKLNIPHCISAMDPSAVSGYMGIDFSLYSLNYLEWNKQYKETARGGNFDIEELNAQYLTAPNYYEICDANGFRLVPHSKNIPYEEPEREECPPSSATRPLSGILVGSFLVLFYFIK